MKEAKKKIFSGNGKKIAVLVGMVLLLVATGVLNYYLSEIRGAGKTDPNGEVVATYFNSFRTDRQAVRQEAITNLDAIIQSADSSKEAKASAEEQKLLMCKNMETELTMENLIKSYGFEDCVVTLSAGNVYVVVKTEDAMTPQQVAQILSVVTQNSDYKPSDVIVTPYN